MSSLHMAGGKGARLFRGQASRPSAAVVILIIALSAVMGLLSPSFLTLDNWLNIANQMSVVLLLALGMTVVLIVRGIDLSVGSVMALSAGVVAWVLGAGYRLETAIVAAVVCGALLGLANGLLITKVGLPDFIATLAMLGIARGLLFLWTDGIPFLGYMTPRFYEIGGLERPFGFFTVPMVISVLAVLSIAIVLRLTSFGLHAYGVGSNPDGARLSGVRVDRVRVIAYVVSGLLAGVAGVILAGRTTTVAPTMGIGFEVQAIAAAVIGGAALTGGRGRALGALLGATVLVATTNAINLSGVTSAWQSVVTGSMLLLAVLLDRLGALIRDRTKELPNPASPAPARVSAPV
jgi:ribose/xylose/arabinose/galactoside ABC-type transport system permease subunit